MKSAICVYARDEADTIQEWIAYHKIIGFDSIIVCDNESSDQTGALARQMALVADVRVLDWLGPSSQITEIEAYRSCCALFAAEFDWIAFLNGCEFIACRKNERVGALLARNAKSSAIVLNWAVFGSNSHVTTPKGLVIESFDRRAPESFGPNRHVKMIVRPTHVTGIGNPHYFEVSGTTDTASGQPADWASGGVLNSIDLQEWRVHRYFTRSREDWNRKIALGHLDIDRNDSLFNDYDRNEVRDRSAAELTTSVWSLLDAVRGL